MTTIRGLFKSNEPRIDIRTKLNLNCTWTLKQRNYQKKKQKKKTTESSFRGYFLFVILFFSLSSNFIRWRLCGSTLVEETIRKNNKGNEDKHC